ncbi:zinc finger and BTB domain-containing protein 17-like [Notolabrus celidotus]|uniref:zinc finger and BTB domain-containing protein 17-like n=1 Tax=Notolabrus celidotus TaxID=1203425 RepID=UPI0014905279|nr:zinc finger and BTB domain-containing protein 17-like [Notolabrus celidotus]
MSADIPPGSLDLESQLVSVMEVLVKAAVTEISQLFSASSVSLQVQLSQSLKENETLKMRMKVMRSELFSLKLQTRTNRPASRFSQIKGNLTKPRVKPLVVIKTPAAQKTVREAVPTSQQSERRNSSAHSQVECADVESPDVILIKDEDDIAECEPDKGQEVFGHSAQSGVATGNLQPIGSSSLSEYDMGLRIVSVHGRGEGPLQEESSLFNITQLQAFSSLSPDHNIPDDDSIDFISGGNDRAPIRGGQDKSVGVLRNSQLDGDSSTLTSSAASNQALQTGVRGAGRLSHINQFPQQQNISPQNLNKSLDCSICGERFLNREDLIAHRAGHTGELPVSCAYCGKSFYNKATLNIHMRIHTGEKPFACPQCGKRFTQKGSLKIHLRIHSGEKPYTCSLCTASFNNPSNLRRHTMTHSANGAL